MYRSFQNEEDNARTQMKEAKECLHRYGEGYKCILRD